MCVSVVLSAKPVEVMVALCLRRRPVNLDHFRTPIVNGFANGSWFPVHPRLKPVTEHHCLQGSREINQANRTEGMPFGHLRH